MKKTIRQREILKELFILYRPEYDAFNPWNRKTPSKHYTRLVKEYYAIEARKHAQAI